MQEPLLSVADSGEEIWDGEEAFVAAVSPALCTQEEEEKAPVPVADLGAGEKSYSSSDEGEGVVSSSSSQCSLASPSSSCSENQGIYLEGLDEPELLQTKPPGAVQVLRSPLQLEDPYCITLACPRTSHWASPCWPLSSPMPLVIIDMFSWMVQHIFCKITLQFITLKEGWPA